jgi:hypothetical protein
VFKHMKRLVHEIHRFALIITFPQFMQNGESLQESGDGSQQGESPQSQYVFSCICSIPWVLKQE